MNVTEQITSAAFGLCLTVLGAAASAEPVVGRVTIEDKWAWTYGFEADILMDAVHIRLGINTVPTGNVSMAELMRLEPDWEARSEAVWDCRFALDAPHLPPLPVRVDVEFRKSPLNHTVLVTRRVSAPHQLEWSVDTTGWLVAHEIGHMLGAYDDYRQGAQDPDDPKEDNASIMRDWPKSGAPQPRHFRRIAAWFSEATGGSEVGIVPATCSEADG